MTDSKPPEQRAEQEQEEWYERTRYQMLMFAVVIVLFGLFLGLILNWYIDPHTSTQKQNLVQALGLITVGAAGAVGIFFTWRGQRLAREAQEENQKNTQEELQLIRQGQITERFTRAIDQLGSEKRQIRLGGIYALEKIDKESPERAYHPTVMEVLTAYVRENSSSKPDQGKGVEQDTESTLRSLPTDIRAILDVLKRREEERVPEEHRVLLDLRESNLEGAFLQGAFLQGAFLWDTNLYRAGLRQANLQEAILYRADLQEANLQGAHLQEADLQRANLKGARLQGADLHGAYLQGADLRGAQGLTDDQIEWTIGSNETQLPQDLKRPAQWSKSIEEQEKIVGEQSDRG